MTGKEFLEFVRQIEEIEEIKWEIEGDALDPDEVKFVFVADAVEHTIRFPEYDEEDTIQKDVQLTAMALVINKFMVQIDNPFRYNIHMDSVEAVNFTRNQVK